MSQFEAMVFILLISLIGYGINEASRVDRQHRAEEALAYRSCMHEAKADSPTCKLKVQAKYGIVLDQDEMR